MMRSILSKILVRGILSSLATYLLLGAVFVSSVESRPVPPTPRPQTIPGAEYSFSRDYHPVHMKGLRTDPNNILRFEFIMDPGDSDLTPEQLSEETEKIMHYFFAALSIPDEDVWVDLSSYAYDRVIPSQLAETRMGKDLLQQDFLLKQVTASVLFPHHDLGREFWLRVMHRAKNELGTAGIPIDTFTKIWIVPEAAVVRVDGNSAYVHHSRLRVLLEQDYRGIQSKEHLKAFELSYNAEHARELAHDIMRDIILPELEEEINFGENFAPLRQIYHTLILAKWFKGQLHANALSEVDLDNIAEDDFFGKQSAALIYEEYLQQFEDGIRMAFPEDFPVKSTPVARQFLSGGVHFGEYIEDVYREEADTIDFDSLQEEYPPVQQVEKQPANDLLSFPLVK